MSQLKSGKNRKQTTAFAIYEQLRVRNYDATRSLCGALAAQQRLLGIYVNGWIPKMPATIVQKQCELAKNRGRGKFAFSGCDAFALGLWCHRVLNVPLTLPGKCFLNVLISNQSKHLNI